MSERGPTAAFNHITFAGMPIIRHGDKVFLINSAPVDLQGRLDAMREQMEDFSDYAEEYRCPFSILREFAQWFDWHERVFAQRQTTGRATCNMIRDRDKRKAFRVDRQPAYIARHRWDVSLRPDHYFFG